MAALLLTKMSVHRIDGSSPKMEGMHMTERYAEHNEEDGLLEHTDASSSDAPLREAETAGTDTPTLSEHAPASEKGSDKAQREQERQLESGEENPT